MTLEQRYESAKELYKKIGVDTDAAIDKLKIYPYPCIVGREMT